MNAPIELRLPPHSITAEQSLIGGLLMDGRAWDRIADIVCEADFYSDAHRRVFQHIERLVNRNKVVDVVTVWNSIEAANEGDQVGGLEYLGEIANNTPSAANVQRYAETVADRARLRALVVAGDQVAALGFGSGNQPAEERIDEALGKLMQLAESKPSKSEPEPIRAVMGAVIDQIQRAHENQGQIQGLECGFADLDLRMSGMQPGDMIVIAGRPSMGKSALAQNIADNVAFAGGCVAVFTLEMTKEQWAKRSLASVGRIDQERMKRGTLTDEEFDRMGGALGQLHDLRYIIDDTGGLTLPRLRARARRIKRQYNGLDLIVIDYLQLLEASKDANNRNDEITVISRGIKAMAKELGCPVIALSQLSRKVEERTDKRPVMSDLRESGAIEQDADIILLMYRDEYYHPNSDFPGIAEVNTAKFRNGATGIDRLVFLKEFSKFVDADHGAVAEMQQRAHENKPVKRRGFDG